MRLRHAVRGFSVLDLPPVKVMFYADDVNLFLNKDEPIAPIVECLDNTSFAIGSKFNHDKTDVKPIGTLAFQHACFDSGSLHGQTLPGSFILPPSAPLHVLGVWVGSSGLAHARWSQIGDHITRLIRQWQAIGASLPNRVLLAKALMQSRCYYLLDGNSIPRRVLKKISNRIMNFVRGPFCRLPFVSLEAPLSSGGINCPSLISRSTAYDLKFLGDLISGSPSVPWKAWTMRNLTLFSHPSSSHCGIHLNPLLQCAFTKSSCLNDCLAAAFKSAQHVSLDLRSFFPSSHTIANMPLLYHPAIPTQFMKLSSHLTTHGIINVSHLYSLPRRLYCTKCIRKVATLQKQLALTPWCLNQEHPRPPTSSAVRIWPTMRNPSSCIRIFMAPVSLLTKHYQVGTVPSPGAGYPFSPYARHDLPRSSGIIPTPFLATVHIWTDGSAEGNGLEHCTTGAAWTSNLCIYDYAAPQGFPLDNNIAEVAAVIMALHSWQLGSIHIHTDSSFVLCLIKGGLLAMECDSWPSFPWIRDPVFHNDDFGHIQMASLYRHLLFLLCSHSGSLDFSWTRAHANDPKNVEANFLAKLGCTDGPALWLDNLVTPDRWVDAYPVLNYQPLSAISTMVIEYTVPPPLHSSRSASFLIRWDNFMSYTFETFIDINLHCCRIWKLNCPVGLCEILWKDLTSSLPLGPLSWKGKHADLTVCPCGISLPPVYGPADDEYWLSPLPPSPSTTPLSLTHIFSGCPYFPIGPLYNSVLCPLLAASSPGIWHKSLDPSLWHSRDWFPLLCFRCIAETLTSKKKCAILRCSTHQCEWIYGSFLWSLWSARMKLAFEPSYELHVPSLADSISSRISSLPLD